MYMAEEYANSSGKFQYRDAHELIEEFSKEISQMKGKCIDIGCGPGNVTKTLLLPKLAPEVELVGADISKQMIEYARKKYSDGKRLSFTCLDAQTEYLPNELVEQFNNVFSFFCLHWCVNQWRTFDNIWKILRPGGNALVMFLAYNDGFEVYKHLSENPLYRPYMQDVDCFIPYYYKCKDQRSSLREILEHTGFEVLHCSKREKTYVFQNEQVLTDHMIAVNPFIDRFPEDLREEYKEDLLQKLMRKKILFRRQNDCDQTAYRILDRYELLVAYVRKPLGACREN